MQRDGYGAMDAWRLEFRELSSLPKLAWLAEVHRDTRIVTVCHGSAVETRHDWCVEGTWDAPFEEGNFHRAENFFGSGIRVDGERLVFSASVALVDRLFHASWNGRFLVANSLLQILARTGARLDPRHNYRTESFASGSGIKSYPNAFQVIHPELHRIFQEYHCNLVLRDVEIERELRSQPRTFASFEEYSRALHEALAAIRDNYRSSGRRHRVDAFATTSSGYDSVAATALARDVGVTEAFAFSVAPGADAREQDSGLPIANTLGFTVHELKSGRQCASGLERYFLAASVEGSEVFLADVASYIASHCDTAVLYTGYHGDVVWKRAGVPPESIDDIRRKDVSGLNLSEVRLVAGFINLAVPFMYGRNTADIARISNSPTMRPWSISKDYDRPIPRRIAESAGVPRPLFGQKKRAQVRFPSNPTDPVLRDQFHDYVSTKSGIPRSQLTAVELLHAADYAVKLVARRVPKLRNAPSLMRLNAPHRFDRRSLMFVWAANGLAGDFAPVYADAAPCAGE